MSRSRLLCLRARSAPEGRLTLRLFILWRRAIIRALIQGGFLYLYLNNRPLCSFDRLRIRDDIYYIHSLYNPAKDSIVIIPVGLGALADEELAGCTVNVIPTPGRRYDAAH